MVPLIPYAKSGFLGVANLGVNVSSTFSAKSQAERGRNIMRMFKTPKEKRTNYTYYTADGERITLTPEDVGKDWIAKLHEEDDDMVKANRRENYHAPVHYDGLATADGDADGLSEKLDILADPTLNPLDQMVEDVKRQEHEDLLDKLGEAVQTLQPQQIDLIHKVYREGRTCASIAAEAGVSRAAVSDRFKKIHKALGKKLNI